MADGNRHRRLDALLTPRSAAVLTVECQRGVVGPGCALPELAAAVRASGALEVTARLVAAAHAAGATVVHAVAERRADGRGSSRNARIFRAAERLPVLQVSRHARRGGGRGDSGRSPATSWCDGCTGCRRSCGTGLDAVLRNLGVRTVVVTGVSANVAVPNAVFDVVNLGYEAVVPADAIAGVPQSYTADILRHTLALVATVTTADEVIGSWERSGPGPGDSGQGH